MPQTLSKEHMTLSDDRKFLSNRISILCPKEKITKRKHGKFLTHNTDSADSEVDTHRHSLHIVLASLVRDWWVECWVKTVTSCSQLIESLEFINVAIIIK